MEAGLLTDSERRNKKNLAVQKLLPREKPAVSRGSGLFSTKSLELPDLGAKGTNSTK